MSDRDQELFAKIKHNHKKLKEKQKGFKKIQDRHKRQNRIRV